MSKWTEVRCSCGKKLFMTDGDKISIKCQGCKDTKIMPLEKLKNIVEKIIKII